MGPLASGSHVDHRGHVGLSAISELKRTIILAALSAPASASVSRTLLIHPNGFPFHQYSDLLLAVCIFSSWLPRGGITYHTILKKINKIKYWELLQVSWGFAQNTLASPLNNVQRVLTGNRSGKKLGAYSKQGFGTQPRARWSGALPPPPHPFPSQLCHMQVISLELSFDDVTGLESGGQSPSKSAQS